MKHHRRRHHRIRVPERSEKIVPSTGTNRMRRTLVPELRNDNPKLDRSSGLAAAKFGTQLRPSLRLRAVKRVRFSVLGNRAVRPIHRLRSQRRLNRHRQEAAEVRPAAEGNGINMRTNMIRISILCVAALALTGCYTKLMTPQEFVQSQRYQVKRTYSDNSTALNYNQSCVSCHSTNELNERYEELSPIGVMSVHNGIPFEPSRWENTAGIPQPIILIAQPDPYWPGPASPVNPWWSPPVTNSGGGVVPAASTGNRTRENGPNRDGNRNGDRETPISTPVYSQPQSNSTPSAPIPTASPATVNSTPAPQPAPSNSGERSRDSNSSSGSTERTRDSGASRDNGASRPR